MFSNSLFSASPQILASVGADCSRYPSWTERRRNASSLALSATLANPHQAGAAYVSLATTVAWKMVCRAFVGKPWCFRVRKANRVCAQAANTLSTCCVNENRHLTVTPWALIDSTRSNPGTGGGGSLISRLLHGETNTISADFVRLSDRLEH